MELAPLEVAIETVESKNSDISSLVDEYTCNSSMDVNPLSMLLNGVIDAAVQGGTVQYREVSVLYTMEPQIWDLYFTRPLLYNKGTGGTRLSLHVV